MDGLLAALLSVIDIATILSLPWYLGLGGLGLAALLLWSAFWSLLTLKIVKAATRILAALLIVIVLSQAGETIAEMIEGPATQNASQ